MEDKKVDMLAEPWTSERPVSTTESWALIRIAQFGKRTCVCRRAAAEPRRGRALVGFVLLGSGCVTPIAWPPLRTSVGVGARLQVPEDAIDSQSSNALETTREVPRVTVPVTSFRAMALPLAILPQLAAAPFDLGFGVDASIPLQSEFQDFRRFTPIGSLAAYPVLTRPLREGGRPWRLGVRIAAGPVLQQRRGAYGEAEVAFGPALVRGDFRCRWRGEARSTPAHSFAALGRGCGVSSLEVFARSGWHVVPHERDDMQWIAGISVQTPAFLGLAVGK